MAALSKEERGKRMGSDPIPRLIFTFALPAVIGMVSGAIYNIVDRIFVGHCVGTGGIAAITACFPTMLIIMAFTLLFCIGGASRVSILFGAGKRDAAEEALTSTFVLLAASGAAAIIASFFVIDPMLRLCGASGDVLESARGYLRIILLGAPFGFFGFGANFLIRAGGYPIYAMSTQVVGAVSNIILDAIFIAGFDMGVVGAAYGTILAQAISAVFGLSFFCRRNAALSPRVRYIRLPRWDVVGAICSVGSASFFMEISFVCYSTLMNRTVIAYGGYIGLSAMGVFLSLDSLLFLPAMAIGEATQPIIGYNYGARKTDRVIKAIYCASAAAIGFYLISFTVAELFARQMMMLFTSDEELLAIGVPGMRVAYIGVPFMGLMIVTNSALQGLGKGAASLLLSFCRHIFCLFMPLIILPRYFGMFGIWFSYTCGDIGGFILAIGFLMWIKRLLKNQDGPDV